MNAEQLEINYLTENDLLFSPEKIPRPPNAFMLYSNDHRKAMAHRYPAETNKEISRRLGQSWKELGSTEKSKYFQKAKNIDMEHKRKFPGYIYNPKDARIRKACKVNCGKEKNFFMPFPVSDQAMFPMFVNPELCQPEQPVFDGAVTGNDVFTPDASSNQFANFAVINLSSSQEVIHDNVQENFKDIGKPEENPLKNYFFPISATEFIKHPELLPNNVEYHREYLEKYFSQVPAYVTYNVTTPEGINFPYVSIPNFSFSQNMLNGGDDGFN